MNPNLSISRRRLVQLCLVLTLFGIILSLASKADTGAAQSEVNPPFGAMKTSTTSADDSILLNGGLNGAYYWNYPNHYTAPDWRRWWIDGTILPEFDRTRGSESYIEGDRAQRYHKWGAVYKAGIYQVVNVTPCVAYELTAWTRNDASGNPLPHAKVGIDPTGTELTSSKNSGAIKHGFPPLTVWSQEQTRLGTWEPLSVTAEALTDQVTAILHAAPDQSSNANPFYSTLWDDASLVERPYEDGKLPQPSSWTPTGYIQGLTTDFITPTLSISWTTQSPASTQVLYAVESAPISITQPLTYTVYFPIVNQAERRPFLSTVPTESHHVTISGLKTGDIVKFIVLSRRPNTDACTTETSGAMQIEIGDANPVALPASEAASIYEGTSSH